MDERLKIEIEDISPPGLGDEKNPYRDFGMGGKKDRLKNPLEEDDSLLKQATGSFVERLKFAGSKLVEGFLPVAEGALKVVQAFEKLESVSAEFAAKIEANSPSVQIGQQMADLEKLKADLYAERQVGPELRELIESQGRQEAAIEKIETNFQKAILPYVQGWQNLKTWITESLADMADTAGKKLDEFRQWDQENWGRLFYYAGIWDERQRDAYIEKKRKEAEDKAKSGDDIFDDQLRMFLGTLVVGPGNGPDKPAQPAPFQVF